MKVFRYILELQDFLFYAQEAVTGTVTPAWLHATALNHALAYAMNLFPEGQPYFMATAEGRNVPAYSSSLIAGAGYYATPGRVENLRSLKPAIFLVKGDKEGYCVKGARAEVLRVSRVSMLPPGTCFTGFIVCNERLPFPERIRLGRFRSPASMRLQEAAVVAFREDGVASHPVDPLVSMTRRGVLVPMLPYPLVDRALVSRYLAVEVENEAFKVAVPDEW